MTNPLSVSPPSVVLRVRSLHDPDSDSRRKLHQRAMNCTNGHKMQAFALSPSANLDVKPYFATASVIIGLIFFFIDRAPESEGLWPQALLMFSWQIHVGFAIALLVFLQQKLPPIPQISLAPWLQVIMGGILTAAILAPVSIMLDAWLGDPEILTFYQWLDEWIAIAPSLTITWLALNLPFLFGFELVKAPESQPIALKIETRLQELADIEPDYYPTESPLIENTAWLDRVEIDSSKEQSIDSDPAAASTAGGPIQNQIAFRRDSEPTCPNTPFWDLIPEDLGKNILLVQSELHYLSVTTDRGKTLILHSLKDALPYLKEIEGIQTHRSVWVARCAIRTIKKVGRQGYVDLLHHDGVPVSRNRMSTVMDWRTRQAPSPISKNAFRSGA